MQSKDVGSSPVAFHFFFFLFNLLVCSSLFLICVDMDISSADFFSKLTFSKHLSGTTPWTRVCAIYKTPLGCYENLIRSDLFIYSSFKSGPISECQTVCFQTRTDVLVLIWEQTVCKGYQQTTKVATDKKRVRKPRK